MVIKIPVQQDVNIPGYGLSRDGYRLSGKETEVRLVLNNTQIKALGTKILAPSPGAGKMIIFRRGLILAHIVTAYTNIDGSVATLNFELGATVVGTAFANVAAFTAMLGSIGNRNLPVAAAGGLLVNTDIDDTPLEAVLANGASGALTGGNVLNTLEIQAWYSVARI